MRAINCDLIFLIFIVIAEYGQAYKNYSLDSSEVCSPTSKRRIKLGTGESSAMLITQNLLSHHPIDWKTESYCKFEVKVAQGSQHGAGIIVVVQRLDLRVSESGECIDYVQFKRRDGTTSAKMCGRINAHSSMVSTSSEEFTRSPYDQYAPNTFVDKDGEVDVHVVVNKKALGRGEKTDIVIALTQFRPCARASPTDTACDIDFQDICIYNGFFDDHIVNCPQYNCLDEGECWNYEPNIPTERESLGNKVLIGSVTSLLIMFALFICCVYMCRKYGALCWSDEFSRPAERAPPVNVNPPRSAPPETPTVSVPEVPPTAPPPDDKDLPPSYDSLFPSR